MSKTPFFKLPYRLVRSTCNKLRKRSFRWDEKWAGNRTWNYFMRLFNEFELSVLSRLWFLVQESWTWSTGMGLVGRTENLLFLIQFFHKFELADQRRREGIQRPFRKWVHLVPTNRLLYYNPRIDSIIHLRRFCVGVHTLLRIISGAKYSGVPHNVHVLPFTRFAKPKSVI